MDVIILECFGDVFSALEWSCRVVSDVLLECRMMNPSAGASFLGGGDSFS